MEVDHVPYIFGSFSRRRHSQEVSSSKGQRVVSHGHSKSQPCEKPTFLNLGRKLSFRIPEELSPVLYNYHSKSSKRSLAEDGNFVCAFCKRLYVEPRVLPCFHTFCFECLQRLEALGEPSEERKRVICPTCGITCSLPAKGVLDLPPDYILQHKLLLASLNNNTAKLLCDLCSDDVFASHRCSECLVNLCPPCTKSHEKLDHELLKLRDRAITKVNRQVMCSEHPDKELSSYCTLCNQVVCTECGLRKHSRHPFDSISKTKDLKVDAVNELMTKTREGTDKIDLASCKMQNQIDSWLAHCTDIEDTIEKFIDEYRKSVEQHRKLLLEQVSLIKNDQLDILKHRQKEIDKKLSDAKRVLNFTDELLREGSDVEILTFADTIRKKLENFDADTAPVPKFSKMYFLENEIKENDVRFPLYGVVSTQQVCPENCIVLEGPENQRVHRRAEVIVETRDAADKPIPHGGEDICTEIWYRDAATTLRSLKADVVDRKDGTYSIGFTPDSPGKLSLAITIRGRHIKSSPFPINVRNIRPHHGIFHCCSFCSSHGSKEATCACAGTMPGGYKGCGHGHDGHPGRRHWSCCGSVLENSECRRISSALYQFTL